MPVTARKSIAHPPQHSIPEASGYGRVEAALAQVYGAEDVQKTAFRGRLKHFRKLGIPVHNPGKGARVDYGEQDIWQLMICLELSEFGIDPSLIVKIVRRHWMVSDYLPRAIDFAKQSPDWMVAIPIRIMSHALTGKSKEIIKETSEGFSFESSSPVGGVQIFKTSDAKTFLKALREPGQRACVFNLSARVRAVETALNESAT